MGKVALDSMKKESNLKDKQTGFFVQNVQVLFLDREKIPPTKNLT